MLQSHNENKTRSLLPCRYSRRPRWPLKLAVIGCIAFPIQIPFSLLLICEPSALAVNLGNGSFQGRLLSPSIQQGLAPSQRLASAGRLANMEREIQRRVNQIRQSRGLATLRWNDKLAQVARNHSGQMARHRFFSHTDRRGHSAFERVQDAGIAFRLVAENLFMSEYIDNPVPEAIDGWMDSRGHRANILRTQVTQTGVGVVQRGDAYYMTQLFIR